MKNLATSLDEVFPLEKSTHLQKALRDAAVASGNAQIRLPSELRTLLANDVDAVQPSDDSASVRYHKRAGDITPDENITTAERRLSHSLEQVASKE